MAQLITCYNDGFQMNTQLEMVVAHKLTSNVHQLCH